VVYLHVYTVIGPVWNNVVFLSLTGDELLSEDVDRTYVSDGDRNQ